MAENDKILILDGDGIGPEIMGEARRLIDWLAARRGLEVEIDEGLVGGCAYERDGTPASDALIALAHEARCVLLGAVGGPEWQGVAYDKRPEAGILRLRRELGLFANLRPARSFAPLLDVSSLKPEIAADVDILVVRELTGGIYFGEPRGIETLADGSRRGVNTQVYTTGEIRRVARVAFELARERRGKLCSVDKANVMESGLLWREEVSELQAREYPDVALTHMYADNCAMQLVRAPGQFDVIVSDNLFGDLLSDEAAMLTGSLGMLPSASLGAPGADGRRAALYEPIHGSAPDIAGQGIANPIAAILSVAMMLRLSFGREADAALVEQAVEDVLARGLRTRDIAREGTAALSTREMGEAILAAMAARHEAAA